MSSGTHINSRTQGFPTEHCNVTQRTMLLTSALSGFKVVVDRCMRLMKGLVIWSYNNIAFFFFLG